MDMSWSLAYQAYLGLANTIGIDRILFATDYPCGSMKAGPPFFDHMPINANEKEKIAHFNVERPLGLGQDAHRRRAAE
jgi:predicted TIM-barrel fold metal-dependent hydrolase